MKLVVVNTEIYSRTDFLSSMRQSTAGGPGMEKWCNHLMAFHTSSEYWVEILSWGTRVERVVSAWRLSLSSS